MAKLWVKQTKRSENLDSLMKPLNLTNLELYDLIAFLKMLTGYKVQELVADAFAAPVGDIEKSWLMGSGNPCRNDQRGKLAEDLF